MRGEEKTRRADTKKTRRLAGDAHKKQNLFLAGFFSAGLFCTSRLAAAGLLCARSFFGNRLFRGSSLLGYGLLCGSFLRRDLLCGGGFLGNRLLCGSCLLYGRLFRGSFFCRNLLGGGFLCYRLFRGSGFLGNRFLCGCFFCYCFCCHIIYFFCGLVNIALSADESAKRDFSMKYFSEKKKLGTEQKPRQNNALRRVLQSASVLLLEYILTSSALNNNDTSVLL